MSAPKTWPENQQPTPEQWTDWFLANDRETQLVVAEQVIENANAAINCFVRHPGTHAEVTA